MGVHLPHLSRVRVAVVNKEVFLSTSSSVFVIDFLDGHQYSNDRNLGTSDLHMC